MQASRHLPSGCIARPAAIVLPSCPPLTAMSCTPPWISVRYVAQQPNAEQNGSSPLLNAGVDHSLRTTKTLACPHVSTQNGPLASVGTAFVFSSPTWAPPLPMKSACRHNIIINPVGKAFVIPPSRHLITSSASMLLPWSTLHPIVTLPLEISW